MVSHKFKPSVTAKPVANQIVQEMTQSFLSYHSRAGSDGRIAESPPVQDLSLLREFLGLVSIASTVSLFLACGEFTKLY